MYFVYKSMPSGKIGSIKSTDRWSATRRLRPHVVSGKKITFIILDQCDTWTECQQSLKWHEAR